MKFQHNESKQNRSLILLAPEKASLHPFSGKITFSNQFHSQLLAEMQRLRGSIYLKDGAISESHLINGRQISPVDASSWHLLILGESGNVLGCTRFRRHQNNVSARDLGVSRAPIANSDVWGYGFRASLDAELDSARRAGFAYVEIGGWALDAEVRGTSEALKSVLATYALAQLQGGAIGISTATERNGSAGILRRLGGRPLEWQGAQIPSYYDDNYGCGMEILRFDSRIPSARYTPMIRELRSTLSHMPVVCPREEMNCWSRLSHGLLGTPAFQPEAPGVPALA